MFTVHLNAFVQDPATKHGIVANRTIEMPVAPVCGLTLMLTEIVQFEVSEVAYNPEDDCWFAQCEDETLNVKLETLAMVEGWYRQAGFEVTAVDLSEAQVRRPHLRLIRSGPKRAHEAAVSQSCAPPAKQPPDRSRDPFDR